jgi:hypothetical protein
VRVRAARIHRKVLKERDPSNEDEEIAEQQRTWIALLYWVGALGLCMVTHPSALSAAVLPPVLGPVMVTTRVCREMRMSMGTGFTPVPAIPFCQMESQPPTRRRVTGDTQSLC